MRKLNKYLKCIYSITKQVLKDQLLQINTIIIDITSANEHDSKIGVRVINEALNNNKIDIVIADKGFRGTCVNYVNDVLGKIIHIGNKLGKHSRNVVERVFGWFTHYNRLNKCYEYAISSAKSMI